VPELDKRISLLRILLAEIGNKQSTLSEMEAQYRSQMSRVVEFVVYREGDVSNALSLMAEVQAKLDEVVQTSNHLDMIVARTNSELEVLLLTKRVAEARSQLAELEERQQALTARLSQNLPTPEIEEGLTPVDQTSEVEDIRTIYDEIEREIARLHDLITEASERAARTVHFKVTEKV